ncbi:tetratricopeptide repeat protein [Enterococcus xiangfangensis]|uniref:Tetratricopeptide repeat protein n=1 Tax=Enterococcus xiangfangensis TaxID=1296537 RepID=A0ABU3FCI7_9ENTE|nr:tetratricopeptide repeat protein [Enterococcus xiangfangensis]MDT2760116.1 tetratricopeptide repeat protein [Enterococcus xiangfangensis]
MNPIEFPNNDQYYLALAEEAFSAGNYQQALEKYQLAYQENSSTKLNHLIASLALEQGEFAEALEYANEAADSYLETAETIDLYLQIQTYSKKFFAAREFLWRGQKEKLLTEEQGELWLLRIDDQEAFYQRQQQTLLKQIEEQLSQLPTLMPMEQLVLVRKIKQLPEERLRSVAEDFMIDSKIAPLVRSYLFESLARVGIADKVRYLTIQAEIVELSPAETGFDVTLQTEIEMQLDEKLRDNDPILLANILEQVKLEMAFLYPLQTAYQKPEAWVSSYLADYLNEAETLDETIEAIREKIKRLMFDYH